VNNPTSFDTPDTRALLDLEEFVPNIAQVLKRAMQPYHNLVDACTRQRILLHENRLFRLGVKVSKVTLFAHVPDSEFCTHAVVEGGAGLNMKRHFQVVS
jgi:hypothetical protein